MPTSDDVAALTVEVGRLSAAVRAEKEAKRTSNRRMSVVIVLLVLLGGWGWLNNNQRIDQIIDVRTGSRQVSCDDRQAFAEAHNFLVLGIVTRNFTRPVPADLDEGTQKQLAPVPSCATPQEVEDYVTGKTTPTKPDYPTITVDGIQP